MSKTNPNPTIRENRRVDNTEPVPTIRLITEIQLDHVVKSHGLNLGQYRSEYDCACGEKIYTDQHTSLHEAQASHIAAAIISQLQRICASEQLADINLILEAHHAEELGTYDYDGIAEDIITLRDTLQTQLEGETHVS